MAGVEEFDPTSLQGASSLSRGDLEAFIQIASAENFDDMNFEDMNFENMNFENIETQLSNMDKLQIPSLMKADKSVWNATSEDLSSDEIRALIKFFTVAEEKLPNCEAGDKSPVIWLCKVLKKRGEFPDKELTRWIKANTSNRFLPYGSVL